MDPEKRLTARARSDGNDGRCGGDTCALYVLHRHSLLLRRTASPRVLQGANIRCRLRFRSGACPVRTHSIPPAALQLQRGAKPRTRPETSKPDGPSRKRPPIVPGCRRQRPFDAVRTADRAAPGQDGGCEASSGKTMRIPTAAAAQTRCRRQKPVRHRGGMAAEKPHPGR